MKDFYKQAVVSLNFQLSRGKELFESQRSIFDSSEDQLMTSYRAAFYNFRVAFVSMTEEQREKFLVKYSDNISQIEVIRLSLEKKVMKALSELQEERAVVFQEKNKIGRFKSKKTHQNKIEVRA